MGLPSPEQLNELTGLVAREGQRCHGTWDKFKNVLESILAKLGPMAAQKGATMAASAAGVGSSGLPVTIATVGGVAIGTTLAPIGAAIAPWIAAATVANQAGKIFSLHDLKTDATKGASANVDYVCHCRQCAKNIGYIIDKKERNVGLVAVGVGTLGVSAVLKAAHSVGKKLYSKYIEKEMRPKERTCRDLIRSAREGCTVAMATIFLLSDNWTFMGDRQAKAMATAVAIITSDDGWEKLHSLW
jgi:hypothetical protein